MGDWRLLVAVGRWMVVGLSDWRRWVMVGRRTADGGWAQRLGRPEDGRPGGGCGRGAADSTAEASRALLAGRLPLKTAG